jgi:hypothetical protein
MRMLARWDGQFSIGYSVPAGYNFPLVMKRAASRIVLPRGAFVLLRFVVAIHHTCSSLLCGRSEWFRVDWLFMYRDPVYYRLRLAVGLAALWVDR